MLFIIAGLALLGLLFASKKILQHNRTRKFLTEIIGSYSELRSKKKLEWEEAIDEVISNRYNRAEDFRTLYHVKQLWKEKADELIENQDEEEAFLRELILVISLVEKSDYAKANEAEKATLFKKYYQSLMDLSSGDDIEAA
ncbi:MAG: hypothetical protein HRU09_05515 [Oligoflexales bacterium]|nr:hypothetical protein [Oligoflexales bacterium]